MEEIARKAAWVHKNLYKIPGSYSENRHWFFKPTPTNNAPSPPTRTSREREFIVESGASLRMMSKSDLTSEEQETVRKSKDPSVTMTANGRTHTKGEGTVFISDLDMSVQVKLLKASPAVISRGNCAKKTVTRMHGTTKSAIISHQEWEKMDGTTDNHVPLVVPGVQATDHQTKALGDRRWTRAVGDHGLKVEKTDLPEWHRPVTEELKGDRQVRQTYLQLTWQYHLQQFILPRIFQQNLLQTNQEESTIHSLSPRPELRSTQTHESCLSAMQKTS